MTRERSNELARLMSDACRTYVEADNAGDKYRADAALDLLGIYQRQAARERDEGRT